MRRYEYEHDFKDRDFAYESFLRFQERELKEEREEKLWRKYIGYKDHSDYRPAQSKEEEVIYNKELDFVTSAGNGNIGECRTLLDQGVNVNANNHYGTALTSAARNNRIEVCQFLIIHKADVELCDVRGENPLMLAVEYGNVDIFNLLISHGANVNVKMGKNGIETTHYHATKYPEMLNLLEEHGWTKPKIELTSSSLLSNEPKLNQEITGIPLVGEETTQDTGILAWCTIL